MSSNLAVIATTTTVDLVLNSNNTSLNLPTNDTGAAVPTADCTKAVLNAVIPIVCVLVFLGTVVVTYFVDDPGLRKLKRSTDKVETTTVSEVDKNYIRYLAEHHMADHVKGHTFSSFSPGYTPHALMTEYGADRRHPRRRACSESHTGHRFSDTSSETQVILEQMLLTIGSGSTYTSLRNRPTFQLPFTHRRTKGDSKTESLATKKDEHDGADDGQHADDSADDDKMENKEEHEKEYNV